jgi:CBS domain-containing protein
MNVGDICNRIVIYVQAPESVQRAAELMRKYHVGDLVVTEEEDGEPMPVGIITDRDIVVEVIAKGEDPAVLTVDDVMSDDLLTVSDDSDISETLDAMLDRQVRRVPVVDDKGVLIGILAIDDLLTVFADQLSALAGIAGNQRLRETARLRD